MMKTRLFLLLAAASSLWGQEASSGFELQTTLSAQGVYSDRLTLPPRSGEPVDAGFRGMFYPTWKISRNWSVSASLQVRTRPYFIDEFTTQGHGVRADFLQAHVTYSKRFKDVSLAVNAGELSSAFGSFLLRYDDSVNPLIDMPISYGYYKGVTAYGLAGGQLDATYKKLDARVQLVNSSPANRRSVFDNDQYANWAGGIGYTIMQGLRIGASAYHGPYLYRGFAYYLRGEAKPKDLPATAYGIDVEWARGHWNAYGELQWFNRPYTVFPTVTQQAGYAEMRRVLHPRWYVAARAGYLRSNMGLPDKNYEAAVGFRPNVHQLIKVGYELSEGPKTRNTYANTIAVQLVTVLRPISVARD
jgi:hypothetical protein